MKTGILTAIGLLAVMGGVGPANADCRMEVKVTNNSSEKIEVEWTKYKEPGHEKLYHKDGIDKTLHPGDSRTIKATVIAPDRGDTARVFLNYGYGGYKTSKFMGGTFRHWKHYKTIQTKKQKCHKTYAISID